MLIHGDRHSRRNFSALLRSCAKAVFPLMQSCHFSDFHRNCTYLNQPPQLLAFLVPCLSEVCCPDMQQASAGGAAAKQEEQKLVDTRGVRRREELVSAATS